ncbi:1,4-alpha-glucan branching protein GlgB [Desulfovibrio subterraneus]|uniref:1,4-alpha-glucan branching enzyme GlgB n=1 Tax=Desulfovibrio subterraneus TaxID=2718620 RepID=A0A7J0BI09_9BACT|nr:1,4-alpha-glucan branching protein GlgB [Desulfovibrio subterraneus]WBF67559.1 1,4-alpha-glucan branching protein GlgB [Desulfovibrio subterraneus]GFM33393.1 1,4-alpha-glucan branching enzyme GlgB [Desulfovibrio subterraneus]
MQTLPTFIEPFDLYLFGKGEHWDLYRILGAHPVEQDGGAGYRFAVWAPNAQEVHLTGDFNDWRYGELPLYPVGSSGIWAAFVPELGKGALYKFGIRGVDGRVMYKTDPMALYAEMRPGIASVTWDLDNHQWQDEAWMQRRLDEGAPLHGPVSIYEVHLGSWMRHHNGYGEHSPFLNYDEIADRLIPYVQEMGFTHIELMPIAEHPLDQSWGYQTSHYYAPTSRFGTPEMLKNFVDRFHQAGIGVILDWVPAHFPKDEWCLGRFDGSALYEHLDPRLGEHPDWGTYIFNYGRHEVRNFLFANALYWLREFHLDGLRIDAVASMLYLDYSRKQGEWVPNMYGGRENLEAVDFLGELNRVVHAEFPGACMVAEESTAWPGVSRPLYAGGLGFTFKWNMGWMHDMLDYMRKDPIYRPHHHSSLTFSMLYAFSENFVLPLSHDEVVHGKGALLSKMPGDMWQQQANLRLLFSYMWAHPGKKLLFMGGEFGQWNEWSEERELDWCLRQFPAHEGIRNLVKDLNGVLVREPAMHKADHDWSGFRWVDITDYAASVISFQRMAPEARPLLWVFNFTPVVRQHYRIACPGGGQWQELLNSDSEHYGGSNVGNNGALMAEQDHFSGGYYLELTLPPLAALCFSPVSSGSK